ncbi:cytochrome P450 [Aspergillus ellipticus CBS 707.79]|uniref:Cytochrome P450 n=1 Tax=Aspergillus ellipticus CBS 707.79 TaxID=1448320 RepID=A0A319E0Y3_9EURO|nr:cytochrome P450 [Aspergillus ellipticus CBS 707.79]
MITKDYPLFIIPQSMLPSLRMEKRIDFGSHVHDQHQSKYTGVVCSPNFVKSCLIDLNKHLGELLPTITEEMRYALNRELPSSKDWHPIPSFETSLRIIGLVSGRVNVGLPLSRRDEWLDQYLQYPIHFFSSVAALSKWPHFLRPIAQYWMPQLREIHEIEGKVQELLAPQFAERRNGLKEKPNTLVQWVWDNSEEEMKTDDYQSKLQILATVPTIYTVAFGVAQCIFDLATRPEYLPMLREEYQSVLQAANGNLTKDSFSKMVKLDSFMKESQRLNPLTMVSFERKVLEPLTLPDGTRLPAGAHLAAPSFHIARDPEYFEDPNEFDGLRFLKLHRDQISSGSLKDQSKHQYVSVDETSLHFGYGRQACPGRWYAAVEIKLLLGSLIMDYDLRLEDAKGGRPTSKVDNMFIYPDPTKMVALRKRV